MTRVGFVGLGSQGGPMARRIIDAGFETTLWARRPVSLEPYAGTSAAVAVTLADLAALSDLVCVCVVDDGDVEQVVTSVLSGLKPGGVIAVHSTVHPDTCRRLADRAAAQGVALVDAPVSGGGPAAAKGQLLMMIGGDAAIVERCRPVFASYASTIVQVGELGAGQVTKLLNNILFTANLATAASAIELGRALGVDPQRLAEVITHGSGDSFALGRIVAAGGTLSRIAAHAGALLAKDVRLAVSVTDTANVTAPSTGIVLAAAEAALAFMDEAGRPA